MAAMAIEGRDKLTLLTSPSMRGFGLWVEQLVAESTGKDGKGIIPVADEPVLSPEHYGDDRLFVYLRVDGDNNHALDGAARRFEESGHPVIRLNMRDRYDLGAELFRWQFAVAVAGAALGMNPFNQPDVQRSKEETDAALREYVSRGRLPEMEPEGSLAGLLDKCGPEPAPSSQTWRSAWRLPLDHGVRPADAGYGPDDCRSEAPRYGGAQNRDDRRVRTAVSALHGIQTNGVDHRSQTAARRSGVLGQAAHQRAPAQVAVRIPWKSTTERMLRENAAARNLSLGVPSSLAAVRTWTSPAAPTHSARSPTRRR